MGDGIIDGATACCVTVRFDAVVFKSLDLVLVPERKLIEPVAESV
jgi:hypothetical protein